jgi:hypothetical protein
MSVYWVSDQPLFGIRPNRNVSRSFYNGDRRKKVIITML